MKHLLTAVMAAGVGGLALAQEFDQEYTILKCLEQVERHYIVRDGAEQVDRNKILRLTWDAARHTTDPQTWMLGQLPDWMVVGIKGDAKAKHSKTTNYAFARLQRLAGALYKFPLMEAHGRLVEERLRQQNGGKPIEFRDESKLPSAVRQYYALMERNRAEYAHLVRPGGNGRPFWNVNAKMFMYPPAFDFKPVAGAAKYEFRVIDDFHYAHLFTNAAPTAAFAPIWEELPVGFVTAECRALDGAGKVIGLAGERNFWRAAEFDPKEYKPAKRDYATACAKIADHLFAWPEVATLIKTGKVDLSLGNNFTSYPSKMQSALIQFALSVAEILPERREELIKVARISADYLISISEPTGKPLAFLPPTYMGAGQTSGKYAGQIMMDYPAEVGLAYARLYEVTRDQKYFTAMERIARAYLRLQLDDCGSWYLKLNMADGKPVCENKLVPIKVIALLEKAFELIGDTKFQVGVERAFSQIESGPLADWNWEGQFEDIKPATAKYQNLTKHNACDVAMYLLRHYPGDAQRLSQARELLRFAEDQFVVWRTPARGDGGGAWWANSSWWAPVALEQYQCYQPIDASVAKFIRTYLALYRAEGNPLDLMKARALGDAMTNVQGDDGQIRTYWFPQPYDKDEPYGSAMFIPAGGDWFNCMAADAEALAQLVQFQ